ncbi:MAG: ATP-binding protein, partial [Acidimicrobiales bacterium]
MRTRLPPPIAYALALIAPIGGVLLSAAIREITGGDTGFLPLFPAVLLVAWLGGLWPGIVATLAALGLEATLFLPPAGPAVSAGIDQWRMLLFAATGAVASGLIESLHRARRRIENARDAERRARRSEHVVRADLESILAAIGDGIVVSDGAGVVRLMNEAAIRLLGRRVATHAELDALLRPEMEPHAADELARGSLAAPIEVHLPSGVGWVHVATFPIVAAAEADGRAVVLRDVTATRRRELVREAFLSIISHELRTPITAIFGGVSVLARPESHIDAETRAEILSDVMGETDRLARLVEDLLVLGRLDEGVQVGLEPSLLQRVVPNAVSRERGSWPEVEVAVQVDADLPPVTGDETSIAQVIRNLISNAAKYSPADSTVDVVIQGGSDEVRVLVLDRGRGLNEKEIARVFEPFYRSAGAAQMAGGVGVGLYVCRRLVEAMGGHVWAKPRSGGGSEFGFALPWWPLEPEQRNQPADQPADQPALS